MRVCAPATSAVEAVLAAADVEPVVANLEPTTIDDVAESFKIVAHACGVPERGEDLVAKFYAHLDRVRRAAEAASSSRPRVLLLEWLDPPFDGGHWVPEQIEAAGCEPARNAAGGRSTGMSWDEVEATDADVVWSHAAASTFVAMSQTPSRTPPALQAESGSRRPVFAVDGNRYFARPAQSLAAGAALVARCAHGPLELAADDLPKRALAGVASTSPLRLARVAPRRLAMRRSRARRGRARRSDGVSRGARRRRLGGGGTQQPSRRQGDARRPGDGLLGLHGAGPPGARQVLRQRLPPLLLRPCECARQGTQDLAAGVAPRAVT